MSRAVAVVAFAAALACFPTPARADEKQACIAASEDAQQLRIDGKLIAARARLRDCARPECPAIVAQDCAQWMADVVAALPTVVLGARDDQGHDVLDVKASMDGAPVTGRLDGRPMPVDPGVHRFRFESTTAAGVRADAEVLVRAGEKNREITVTLGGGSGPAAPRAPSDAREGGRAAVPALAWVFGGVAVAALGTALAFDVAQAVDYDHLSATCAGHCSPSQVDHVAAERWIAGVTAGVGALSLGAAIYFFLARPSARASLAGPVVLDVTTLLRGAAGSVVVRF
jgi:hypothetical protein